MELMSADNAGIRRVSKWSLVPLQDLIEKKLFNKPADSLLTVASKVWEIAPSVSRVEPKAYFLSDQIERVQSYAFTKNNWSQTIHGGVISEHSPTKGILLKDVWLIDGSLYKGSVSSYLSDRANYFPKIKVSEEINSGAVYCTPGGNAYFGQWLIDDCVSYLLAVNYGLPITSNCNISGHAKDYEKIFGMTPHRTTGAYFKELTIFDDVGQNASKHQRFRALNKMLLSGVNVTPHPGVFILRGKSGALRQLENELEIAEYLRQKRGFRILDPLKESVATIVQQCAGAETVIGVEGSHLIHGVMLLPEGGSVMIIQPPNRFCTLIKDLTDRDGQHFGFVVGQKSEQGFTANIDEIERTLDMMPRLY